MYKVGCTFAFGADTAKNTTSVLLSTYITLKHLAVQKMDGYFMIIQYILVIKITIQAFMEEYQQEKVKALFEDDHKQYRSQFETKK